jgi:hypothetical protein
MQVHCIAMYIMQAHWMIYAMICRHTEGLITLYAGTLNDYCNVQYECRYTEWLLGCTYAATLHDWLRCTVCWEPEWLVHCMNEWLIEMYTGAVFLSAPGLLWAHDHPSPVPRWVQQQLQVGPLLIRLYSIREHSGRLQTSLKVCKEQFHTPTGASVEKKPD